MKSASTLSLGLLLSTGASVAQAGSITIFEDTSDRVLTPSTSDDPVVSLGGDGSGQSSDIGLGPIELTGRTFNETGSGSTIGISNDQLLIEAGSSAGASGGIVIFEHNFVDQAILDAGEFTVSLEIDASTAGATRFFGFGIGSSIERFEAAGGANVDQLTISDSLSDLFVGIDPAAAAGSGAGVFPGGIPALIEDVGTPNQNPDILTLRVFNITSFDANSTFDFEVFFNGANGGTTPFATGQHFFSGDNENFLIIASNNSNNSFGDNFSVTTLEPIDVGATLIPAPSAVLPGALGLVWLAGRRRRQA